MSEELRELSQDLGVDLDASGSTVIDHFGYEATLGAADHAAVLAAATTPSRAVLSDPLPGPVLFRGIGLSVSPESETVRAARGQGGMRAGTMAGAVRRVGCRCLRAAAVACACAGA